MDQHLTLDSSTGAILSESFEDAQVFAVHQTHERSKWQRVRMRLPLAAARRIMNPLLATDGFGACDVAVEEVVSRDLGRWDRLSASCTRY
jgi:hypothetical protein